MTNTNFRALIKIVVFLITGITASQSQNDVKKIKLEYHLRELKNENLHEKEIIANYDSIIQLCMETGDILTATIYSFKKGQTLSSGTRHLNAYSTFQYSLNLLHSINPDSTTQVLERELLLALAKEARRLGLFEESAKQCFSLLAISKGKDQQKELIAYSILSIVYMTLGNEQDAEIFQSQADALYSTMPGIDMEAYVTYWNCKSGLTAIKGDIDLSLNYLNTTLSYLDSCQYTGEQYIFLTNNIANVYYSIGAYELALNYYQRIAERWEDRPSSWYKADNLYNIGRCYAAIDSTARASIYYQQCLDMASHMEANDIKGWTYLALSDILFAQGLDRQSRIYLDSGYRLLNQVSALQNAVNLNILKNHYETKALQEELVSAQSSISHWKTQEETWRTLALCMCTLAISLSIVAVILYQKRKKTLAEKKNLQNRFAALQNRKETEFQNIQQQYNLQIEAKEEQVSILCQIMVKARTIVDQLSMEVKAMEENPSSKGLELGKLKQQLDAYKADDYWQFFDTYLHWQYCNFHKRLIEDYPDLTKNDIRFCMLMAIGMTTKDIAVFTSRAVRTIESQIYRLRKKMNVPSNVKLGDFLSSYME